MRKLPHRLQLRFAILAAMALLLAQAGAISHAYSHSAGLTTSSSHSTGAGSHDPCSGCLAFAPLLCGAGAPNCAPFIVPPGPNFATRALPGSFVDVPRLLAFRSRAPPDTH